MDKSILDNEDASSKQSSKQEAENSIVVESKEIDVLSLPKKASEQPLSNDKPLDDEWLALSQDWQAQSVPKTDVEQLLKRTRRRTRGAKICLSLNVLATLGLLIAFVYGVLDGKFGKPFNTYIGIGGLLSIVLVYYELKIRLTAWKSLCDSPSKAIDHAITSCESSMQYMVLTKVSTIPFFFLMNWFIYTVGQTSEKPIIPVVLFGNIFIVGVYLVAEYFHRKRKKEYQQLITLKGTE